MNTSPPPEDAASQALAGTGIAGLDDILGGGLARSRLYLVEGMPGSGKTTLAFQFLLEGVHLGGMKHRVLLIGFQAVLCGSQFAHDDAVERPSVRGGDRPGFFW